MLTNRDARDYIESTLGQHIDGFDVDAIVRECRQAADGWDFDKIPSADFWAIVERHDINASR